MLITQNSTPDKKTKSLPVKNYKYTLTKFYLSLKFVNFTPEKYLCASILELSIQPILTTT